jgi:nitroimidazol reductase NimA-like FMN-containing flavoprotein (pyridoxamine 5'-phosphate oxidase superfamily)
LSEDPEATARRLVDEAMYMTLATADDEGRPWASPLWFAASGYSQFLWVSDPEARHSRNLAARPEVAIVIFDSTVRIGAAEAVYVEAVAQEVPAPELEQAIAIYSARSTALGAREWTLADVTRPTSLRLYRAKASAWFVLGPNDRRVPVTPAAD